MEHENTRWKAGDDMFGGNSQKRHGSHSVAGLAGS